MCMRLSMVLLPMAAVSLMPPGMLADPASPASMSTQLEKRFSINMMDPLTRRSALDKNFVRFGRSNGGNGGTREGRGRPDSFVRFGRIPGDLDAEEDDETEAGHSRDARARTDFIRFGRGGKDSGFIRFGRGRNDNFVRFGRGRQDNFIRFGKSLASEDQLDEEDENGWSSEGPYNRGLRRTGDRNSNFVRFGKRDPEKDEQVVNAYRNTMKGALEAVGDGVPNDLLMNRMGRLAMKNKPDGFIRFGRSQISKLHNYQDETAWANLLSANRFQEPEEENTAGESERGSSKSEVDENGSDRVKRSLPIDKDTSTSDNQDLAFLSPLAAGLSNLIVGSELSAVLPPQTSQRNHHFKSTCDHHNEDRNFIRLG